MHHVNFQHGFNRLFSKTSQFLLAILIVSALIITGWQAASAARLAAIKDSGLQFDGLNDYVDFGTATDLGVQTFTIETWFKKTGPGAKASTGLGGLSAVPLVTKGRGEAENSNKDMNYFFGIDGSGHLVADFEECAQTQLGCPATASNAAGGGQNFPARGTAVIKNFVWHHAAVTFDGRYWQFYLDGVADGAPIDTGENRLPRWDSIQHAGLGTALTSTGKSNGYFQGALDEVRIWNVARTQLEIATDMNNELTSGTGLIGRWGLNEGSGTTAFNSIAGSNGTLINDPLWYTPDVTPPSPPTSLTATAINSGVNLSWTAPVSTDVLGYNIYRDTVSPVTLTSPINGSTLLAGTAYVDSGRTNGTTYFYVVTAVDTSFNESAASNEVSATPNVLLGNGLAFDGINDYVTFGNAAGLGLQHFTVETWFKRTGAGVAVMTDTNGVNAIPLVTKGAPETDGNTLNENYILGIRPSDNVLAADFETLNLCGGRPAGDNNPLVGITPILNNVWYHAAFTYDGAALKLYLNGNLESSLANTCIPADNSIQQAALGTYLNSTGVPAGYFNGVLDEVRIWNHARTPLEIQNSMNQELLSGSGLVARWGLNEGSTTRINSSVGTFPGTLKSGTAWTFGSPFNLPLCYALTLSHAGQGSDPLASPANSSVCPAGKFTAGESIGLSGAAPATGWVIDGWAGTDNDGSTAVTNTVTMPDVDHPASVIYTQVEYNLTITMTGNGTITADKAAPYHYGDVVKLTATPNPTWSFTNWSGNATGSANPLSVIINSDKTINAVFTQGQFALVTNVTGSGSITRNPDQATYSSGTSVTLTAVPAAGWSFTSWSGDASGSTNPVIVLMNAGKTVNALFTQNNPKPAVPVTISPVGTITDVLPTYVWNASTSATSYWLSVYNQSKGAYAISGMVVPASVCTGVPSICRFHPSVPLGTFTYRFSVAALNAGGNSGFSPWANWKIFTVRRLAAYVSIATQDGYLLESTETSGVGGALNTSSSVLIVGDNSLKRQYRSLLSFNTASLPDNAVIVSATLKLKKQGGAGVDPFNTHGNLWVDMRKPFFGATAGLQLDDFAALAGVSNAGVVGKTPVNGQYLGKLGGASFAQVNKLGFTQLRLRFGIDDNNNAIADYLAFYSGNVAVAAYRPVLEIVYYIP
jgi:hypothetical protein